MINKMFQCDIESFWLLAVGSGAVYWLERMTGRARAIVRLSESMSFPPAPLTYTVLPAPLTYTILYYLMEPTVVDPVVYLCLKSGSQH